MDGEEPPQTSDRRRVSPNTSDRKATSTGRAEKLSIKKVSNLFCLQNLSSQKKAQMVKKYR